MKQLSVVLPAYAFDISGVCSALYELGGLVVMHDASGCNSSYTTFDEPRWFERDSMIYGSGLDETDAMLGGDDRLIDDTVRAAADLRPKFIAVAGGPVPMMIGTDFEGIARVIERRTGIPTFGFFTNGTHVYTSGASMAFAALARRVAAGDFSKEEARPAAGPAQSPARAAKPALGVLGVTPLDFSTGENLPALRGFFERRGYPIVSVWAMGSTLGELARAGQARVNVVAASCGLAAAKELRQAFGTPWVAGLPVGEAAGDELCALIDAAARDGENRILQAASADAASADAGPSGAAQTESAPALIIGEQVYANSLRFCLTREYGIEDVRALCPLEPPEELLLPGADSDDAAEEDIARALSRSGLVFADPLYRHLLPQKNPPRFVEMPHEALSGRLFHGQIPCVMGGGVTAHLAKSGLAKP